MTKPVYPRRKGGHVFYCVSCQGNSIFYSIAPDGEVILQCGACGNTDKRPRLRKQERDVGARLYVCNEMPT